MEICLKSTNKEYTKLAINTFLSDVKDLKFEPVYDAVFLVGVLEYAPLYFADSKNPSSSIF